MDIVVVGSGIAGLTAAILFARRGHPVTVLEAGPHTAPLLRGFTRDGTHFDTGFHCGGGVHPGGPLAAWLRVLGVADVLAPCDTPVPESVWHDDGGILTMPGGRDGLLAYAMDVQPRCVPELERFLEDVDAVLAHSPYLTPGAKVVPDFPGIRGAGLVERLVEADLPPELNQLLCVRCLNYGVPPSRASFNDFALVVGPYIASSGTWQGGGKALAEALEKELDKTGGVVLHDAEVTAIEADGDGISAVLLRDGRRIPCRGCVFTGHPAQLENLLPVGAMRKAWFTHIGDFLETPMAITVFGRLAGGRFHEGIRYLLPRPHESLRENPAALDAMFDVDGKSACLLAGAPDDAGRTPVTILQLLDPKTIPPGDPRPRPWDYSRTKAAWIERAMAVARERCPDLEDFEPMCAASPLTMRHHVHGSTGSLYGVAHERNTLPLVPATRLPGLWLAGQNILLPGVLGGIVSGALAVGFALGHDAVLAELAACANR
ncbi:MAG: FAD-dependent oxidoreductase [Desulfovibrio sp.]|jgi:all-trans-retinol 13,14-reductase|nr:FAD-dependent oxidoreductase [Desulfovibrio sp.]